LGLVLSNNQLTTLPESVGQLSQLQILRLDGNRLTTLPEALRKLTRLEQLYLHDNEALGLPAEVLGPSWEGTPFNSAKPAAILDYYFRMRSDGEYPLNETKLILVGRGAVGKTSIVNRLIHGTFEDVKKTEGIKITEWTLTVGEKKSVSRACSDGPCACFFLPVRVYGMPVRVNFLSRDCYDCRCGPILSRCA